MKHRNPLHLSARSAAKSTKYLADKSKAFLIGLGLFVTLIGVVGCSVQIDSQGDQPLPQPTLTNVLKNTAATVAAIPTRPSGEILARITRAPGNAYLETFTPIPTTTSVTTVNSESGTALSATAVAVLEETVEVEETQPPTQTTTPQPTNAPNVTPTPPLPPLPEVLSPPIISQTIKVPILMYHYVSTPPEDANKYRVNLSVEPETFRAQMQWLQDHGYRTIDLYDVIEVLATGAEPPEKVVVLTFDDGYLDNYENAYPILEEFGFEGTFFIPTEFIDFGYEGYMTWEMIEEMAADGHRFESHTKNHPDLALLKRNDHVWQILGSQETLAAHLGYKPRFFSYPSGSYSDLTLEMVESLSIWAAVTTQGGTWRGFHDRYEWKRTRVSYGTTLRDFEKVFGE